MEAVRKGAFLGHPWVAYVAPFVVFLALLALGQHLPIGVWDQPLRVLVLAAVLWVCSRRVIDLRVQSVAGSVVMGLAVFLIWIGPDVISADYRRHWLFENAITGAAGGTSLADYASDPVFLVFRTIRAVILVPLIEELFWRGWLMRWIIQSEFEKVPLGTYAARAFWITAVLFASEHGPYWDVGLIAGVLYNWWMIHTKRLGDCILAHAVTNGVLSGYVIIAGKWEYWM